MFEIGNSLREARLRQHLDFPELEHTTKIRAKYLRALEDERFELLPSHTYIKGFLRSYADSLGLDGQLYVDEYNSRFVIGEDEVPMRTRRVPAARSRKRERRESSMVLLALTLIGVFTALVIAAWRFGGADDPAVRGLQPPAPAAQNIPAGTPRHGAARDPWPPQRVVRRSAPRWSTRQEAVRRNGRAGPEAALHGQGALALCPHAEERDREAERQSRHAPVGREATGRVRVRQPRSRRRQGLSSRRPRAAIVVTGSELVRGERTDLNGPFLARALLAVGLEPARIHVVGDNPDELERTLREAVADADLVAVSGGLGPTHDDRTVELVAKVAGRELEVRADLYQEIESFSRSVAERMRRPFADFEAGVRKQATLPAGAESLGLAGTAPGLVVEVGETPVVVLPGPPPELQRLWPNALTTEPVRRVLDRGRPPLRRTLRFFGPGESTVAHAFAEAGGDGDGVEVTICARDFEVVLELFAEPEAEAEARAERLIGELRERLGRHLYSDDGRTIEEIVLEQCRQRGLRLVTAESCTGGLLAARLTAVPGYSDVTLGGIVAYGNELKETELGVSPELIEEHGAVSAEVAEAMAVGARERLGADVSISITGVAGPGGGTEEKPVGLVLYHAVTPDGSRGGTFNFPGDRDSIRRRAVVAWLHLVRALLSQNRNEVV